MRELPAYILAGGQSSRFGSDKALATVQGTPLIRRVADAAAARCRPVTVVARREGEYEGLGLRTIADRLAGLGPMAGLHAALLDHVSGDWLLLLSCDLLQLEMRWIDRLLEHRLPGCLAVAFRPDRWQPLLALYHRDLLDQVQARLDRRELAMHRLLDHARCRIAPLPPDWPPLLQANRPEQLPGEAPGNRRPDPLDPPEQAQPPRHRP